MVTNVTSLLKTVKSVEDEAVKGPRAIEQTISSIKQEMKVCDGDDYRQLGSGTGRCTSCSGKAQLKAGYDEAQVVALEVVQWTRSWIVGKIFYRVSQKDFFLGGPKLLKYDLAHAKLAKPSFFPEKVIGNCQNAGGPNLPFSPFLTPMTTLIYYSSCFPFLLQYLPLAPTFQLLLRSQLLNSVADEERRASPEELIHVTKPITNATSKAVAAGRSCRQEDMIVCANMGRKAVFDMIHICRVSLWANGSFHLRKRKIGSFHLRKPKIRSFHLQKPKIGSFHLRKPAIGSFHLRKAKIRNFHIRKAKIRNFHIRKPKIGSFYLRKPFKWSLLVLSASEYPQNILCASFVSQICRFVEKQKLTSSVTISNLLLSLLGNCHRPPQPTLKTKSSSKTLSKWVKLCQKLTSTCLATF